MFWTTTCKISWIKMTHTAWLAQVTSNTNTDTIKENTK